MLLGERAVAEPGALAMLNTSLSAIASMVRPLPDARGILPRCARLWAPRSLTRWRIKYDHGSHVSVLVRSHHRAEPRGEREVPLDEGRTVARPLGRSRSHGQARIGDDSQGFVGEFLKAEIARHVGQRRRGDIAAE